MKQLLRAPLLVLLVLALLASCDDDPLKDKVKYTVALRVTGQNLAGLGAEMHYTSVRNTTTNPQPGPSGHYTYAVRADSTYNLGEFGWYDHLDAAIALRNVSCSSALQPAANSWLKLEMLVNGRVVDRVELNSASRNTVTCAPYWLIGMGAEGDDWD
ncbi:hypothetical protein [Hymenobacter latericus]|uniref:hypothetical protein n=1 Tax=Hymenobacter sp. YIM 151858-1 TaxID=2987688 RepID=UPI002227BB96|nr:hypothetical protein [Hymenobacter sp. YIM 151858-1]UYZ57420.1 hypothetical protein OIS50_10090 [Hymenobacter sp. YIM 151858-1]